MTHWFQRRCRAGRYPALPIVTALLAATSACALDPDPSETAAIATSALTAGELAAANAEVLSRPVGSGSHCTILLEKIHPGHTESRVLSYECAETQVEADALPAAASTLLMTWYKDIRFGGDSVPIRGVDGPCDASGYGFSDINADGWNDSISSFKGWNRCNRAVAYDHKNYGDPAQNYAQRPGANGEALYIDWVGAALNDKISSIRTWQHPF